MSKIIDRTGKGSNISQSENDSNLDSLHGINQGIAGATHTVDITDQGDTLEFTNGGAVAVTLDSIATILAAAHTSDFKVTLISIGAATVVTITPDALDTINTGALTIVLSENQYVTIQTDSTNVIWNIIDSSNARNLDGIAATSFLRSDVADTAAGLITFSANNIHNGDETFNGDVDLAGLFFLGGLQITPTAAELNNIDGATGATATTVVDADRVVFNDSSVMKQVAVTDLDTYFSATTKTLTNKALTSPVITDGEANTQTQGDNSTKLATTEYADAKMVTGTKDTGATTPLTFGSIPAGTKKITIMYNALANSSGIVTLRIGDSGGIETSGYICSEAKIGTTTSGTSTTIYFYVSSNNGTIYGSTVLTLIDPSNNTWIVNGSAQSSGGVIKVVTGSKSLTGALTQLELTIANRTGGSVNIMYEQ